MPSLLGMLEARKTMGAMDQLIALLGAVVGAGIAATAAVITTRRKVSAEWKLADEIRLQARHLAVTERVSTYLAASYHGVLSLRDLALADYGDKLRIEKAEVWPTVDRVNSALVAVQINDSVGIVAAIEAIDASMVVLAREARDVRFTHDEWRARRNQLMGQLPQQAIAAARAEVGPMD